MGVNSQSIVFALPIDNVCVSNVAQITRWTKPNLPQIRKLNFFIYLTSYKSNIYYILSLKSVPERNFQSIRSISHHILYSYGNIIKYSWKVKFTLKDFEIAKNWSKLNSYIFSLSVPLLLGLKGSLGKNNVFLESIRNVETVYLTLKKDWENKRWFHLWNILSKI